MHEFRKIIGAYERVDFSQRKAALATVVRVKGSSYRRPGARMLMTDDGRWTGAISGGCLEGDALRRARQAILHDCPSVVVYDTMDEDAGSLGVGLGCNGIIEVLIEPIHPEKNDNPIAMLASALHPSEATVLATVFAVEGHSSVQLGAQLLRQSDGEIMGNLTDDALRTQLLEAIELAFETDKSLIKQYQWEEASAEVLLEVIHPGIHLMVFGAGYDVAPLVRLAKNVDWHVTVTDDCIAHAIPKRFPEADAVVYAPRETILEHLAPNRFTAVLLMSHNFIYDLAILKDLITTQASYIGILGPKKRGDKLLLELQNSGLTIPADVRSRIYSPVGLDIGAETPEEIALSVVAEIQARFNGKAGGLLRGKSGPIHTAVDNLEPERDFSKEKYDGNACSIN